MNNQEIAIFKNFGVSTPANISYSNSINAFIANAWTSYTNRTYCCPVRVGRGLLIKEDMGTNDYGSYLNAVHIYDIRTHALVAEKVFPMYQGLYYSTSTVKNVVYEILEDTLSTMARKQHESLAYNWKEQLRAFVNEIFNTNQIEMLRKEMVALEH